MSYLLSALAARLDAVFIGEDVVISQVASLQSATPQHITFFNDVRYAEALQSSAAGAVLLNESHADLTTRPRILVDNPYLAFARISTLLNPAPRPQAGISPHAIVATSAHVHPTSEIGAQVTIGERVEVGKEVIIHPGCHIADDVVIGDNSILYPRVTVYRQSVLGKRVMIQAGAVIGSDGFGNVRDSEEWVSIPQIGRVILEDDVHVGANTTIDRGVLDDTIIRRGARLDNLIQVAHNVEIGQNTAIAGCVGIAGSAKIGANCLLGGAAMISGHLTITDGVVILGGTLVAKSILKPGVYAGPYPMQPHAAWRENAAQLRHLKQLAHRVKMLEKQLPASDDASEA